MSPHLLTSCHLSVSCHLLASHQLWASHQALLSSWLSDRCSLSPNQCLLLLPVQLTFRPPEPSACCVLPACYMWAMGQVESFYTEICSFSCPSSPLYRAQVHLQTSSQVIRLLLILWSCLFQALCFRTHSPCYCSSCPSTYRPVLLASWLLSAPLL